MSTPHKNMGLLCIGSAKGAHTDGRNKELFKNAGAQWGKILHVGVDLRVSGTSEAEMLSSLCF